MGLDTFNAELRGVREQYAANASLTPEVAAENARTKVRKLSALDESPGSAAKRLADIGVEDTFENRQAMRGLFMDVDTDGEESNAIIHTEHGEYKTADGVSYLDRMQANGRAYGLKTDRGLVQLAESGETGEAGESVPKEGSVEALDAQLDEFIPQGIVFTKWRTTHVIKYDADGNMVFPTAKNTKHTSSIQARQAKKTQDRNVIPIVEPEMLYQPNAEKEAPGDHTIEQAYEAGNFVLDGMFAALAEEEVDPARLVLKRSFVTQGHKFVGEVTAEQVARLTAKSMIKTSPTNLAGIVFLSGGLTDEEAIVYLDETNKVLQDSYAELEAEVIAELEAEGNTARAQEIRDGGTPAWLADGNVTQSYGRGAQRLALHVWGGDEANIPLAKKVYLFVMSRTNAASEGRLGDFETLVGGSGLSELLDLTKIQDPKEAAPQVRDALNAMGLDTFNAELSGVREQYAANASFTTAPEQVGGIDLNPAMMSLQIKRDGAGIPLPVFDQPIESFNIDGFAPVIINVAPVTNLPMLLGGTENNFKPRTDISFNLSKAEKEDLE